MPPSQQECIAAAMAAMGPAMDAKPAEVNNMFSLAAKVLDNIDSSLVVMVAPIRVWKRYSLLQTVALALKEAGASVSIYEMPQQYASVGFKAGLGAKLLLSTTAVPTNAQPNLVITLDSKPELLMGKFADGIPLLATKHHFTATGVTPTYTKATFAAGKLSEAAPGGDEEEEEEVELRYNPESDAELERMPLPKYKLGELYLDGNGDVLKMLRTSGVEGDVVVRKMEIDEDDQGRAKYFPGVETVINLRVEKRRGGGLLSDAETCTYFLKKAQANTINLLPEYLAMVRIPSAWTVPEETEEESKARKRKCHSF